MLLGTLGIEIPCVVSCYLLPVLCGKAFFSVFDYADDCRSGFSDFSRVTVGLYLAVLAVFLYWLIVTGEISILIITVFVFLILLARHAR